MKKGIACALLLALPWGVRQLTSATDQGAAEPSVCVVTHVDVMPNFTAAGRDLLRQAAEATRKEPGALRIEVFEELNRPNHSTVVELWASRQSYDDHLATTANRAYRTKLQPMLGSPFDERLHRPSP